MSFAFSFVIEDPAPGQGFLPVALCLRTAGAPPPAVNGFGTSLRFCKVGLSSRLALRNCSFSFQVSILGKTAFQVTLGRMSMPTARC